LQTESRPKQAIVDSVQEHWSSTIVSMLSLYMASTAGKDWSIIAQPLLDISPLVYMLFLLYMTFFLFVVTNTLTSLFVEATIQNSDHDVQMVIQLELDRKDLYIRQLQAFFDEMDQDGDGQITYMDFCKHADHHLIHAFASSLEIDITDAKQFFCMLSGNGSRSVDIETFVVGCIKLKGAAKSMDLMDLIFQFRKFTATQVEYNLHHDQRLQSIEQTLGVSLSGQSCGTGLYVKGRAGLLGRSSDYVFSRDITASDDRGSERLHRDTKSSLNSTNAI